jgi:hypothetical protein
MYCGREADLERDIGSILDAGSAGVVVMSDAKGMLDAGCWMLDAGSASVVVRCGCGLQSSIPTAASTAPELPVF